MKRSSKSGRTNRTVFSNVFIKWTRLPKLRRYESKDFGPRVFNTAPLRFGSYGDPPLVLGKPVGYHTERFLRDKGYSAEEISALEEKGAIRCWHGEDLDDIPVLRSKRDLAGE